MAYLINLPVYLLILLVLVSIGIFIVPRVAGCLLVALYLSALLLSMFSPPV
jgi:hypothetical protein